MPTISFSSVIDTSLITDLTLKNRVEAILAQFGSVPEGQKMFASIRDGEGMIQITNNGGSGAENTTGYLPQSNILNLNMNELETTRVKFEGTGYAVNSLNRTMFHELTHVAENRTNPDIKKFEETNHEPTKDAYKSLIEKHTVNEANEFMDKYYSEPHRFSEYYLNNNGFSKHPLNRDQPQEDLPFYDTFNPNPDYVEPEDRPSFFDELIGKLLSIAGVNYSSGAGLGGYDPLTFDLDGDGQIELTSVANGVHYDFWNDGFAEKTGWVSADDGMLVWDKDGDGKIEGFGELIASAYPLSYVIENPDNSINEENGFAQLLLLDDNGDGIIDAQDSIYNTLQVWQDLNQNGISEVGELHSLADLNIASIDAGGAQQEAFAWGAGFFRVIEGNTVSHNSTYTLTDGTIHEIVDVWFDHNLQNSIYTQDYTLDIRTLFLPTLRGYGNLPDLHVAMSQNESLLTQVEGFATSKTNLDQIFTDFSATQNDIRSILLGWAGVEDTMAPALSDIGDDGVYAYMPEYNFLAEFTGIESQYLGTWFDERPFMPSLEEGIPAVQNGFNNLVDGLGARIILQSGASVLFENTPIYNPITDVFEGDLSLSQTGIAALGTSLSGSGDVVESWRGVASFIDSVAGVENLTTSEATWLNDAVQLSSGNALNWTDVTASFETNIIDGVNAQTTYEGTDYDDVINGNWGAGAGSDDALTLNGHAGNDILQGEDGDDVLSGGLGNDILRGGWGSDTFIYDYGHDIIENGPGNSIIVDTEIIQFGAGINVDDVSLVFAKTTQSIGSYVLQVNGRGTISISDDGAYWTSISQQIDELHFADGTIIQFPDMDVTYLGSSETDWIQTGYGFVGKEILYGFEGDDSLSLNSGSASSSEVYGGSGNDTISLNGSSPSYADGGEGDDLITGYDADNSYYFSKGNDAIQDSFGGIDTIILPDGYGLEDLEFYKTNTPYFYYSSSDYAHATISISGYGSITIDTQFYYRESDNSAVEYLKLNDGTLVSLSDQVFEATGTSGDNLFADSATWGNKDSVYNFTAGHDEIYDDGGIDTIVFSSNYALSDITFTRGKYEGGYGGSETYGSLNIADHLGNRTQIYNQFKYDNYTNNIPFAIEFAEFSDGTIIDLQALEIETHGTSGDDQIAGLEFGDASPDDTIYGHEGNDSIFGGLGNDLINPGAGDDYITGDVGDDVVAYKMSDNIANTDLYWGNVGYDTLRLVLTQEEYDRADVQSDIASYQQIISQYSDTTRTYGGNNVFTFSVFDLKADAFENLEIVIDDIGSIIGTENNDVLTDTTSDDLIYGLGGDDRLVYTSGSDVFNGGAGLDAADFSMFDKAVWVDLSYVGIESWHRNGTDLLSGAWESMVDLTNIENVIGTAYDDGLYGDAGANVISGGAGDDYLYGNAGDDRFVYTSGADEFNGGTGSDTADFSQFDKAIWVDLNYAGIESWHRNGTDLLTGAWESMADLTNIENVIGTAYDDGLYGNAGANVISGGAGDDYLYGNAGDDRFVYTSGADEFNGSTGSDTADFSQFDKAIWVDLNYVGIESWHRNGTDLLTGAWESMADLTDIENIIGTAYDDGLYGDAGANVISGGAGDDVIFAGAGNDTSYGDAGDDRFVYGAGSDVLNGGAGTDTADFSEFGKAIWVDLSYLGIESWHRNGTDLLSGAWESMANLTDIENVIGTAYDDGLYGDAGANVISGGAGDDTLFGGDGNDVLSGSVGFDTAVYAGSYANYAITNNGSNFTVVDNVSNEGTDTVDGVEKFRFADGVYENGLFTPYINTAPIANNDFFVGDEDIPVVGNLLVDNGYGVDRDPDPDGYPLSIIAVSGLATAQGGSVDISSNGDFTYTSSLGFTGDDSFTYVLEDGQGGSDTATVNLIINIIDGALIGSSANDSLTGGDGADSIYGLGGTDYLYGGAGNDTYIYNLGDGNDTISDASGVDKLLFGTGISQDDIRLVRDGNYLNIHIGANIIRLENQFYTSTTTVIETAEFADGSTLSLTDNFTWEGTDGVDTLNGFDADETFIGHGGDDNLYGGAGDDTYVYNLGDGSDYISDASGVDKLLFGTAISQDDIRLVRDGNYLNIHIGANIIRLENQFYTSTTTVIETAEFADGSTLSLTDNFTWEGTDGVDTLNGFDADETFIGHEGDDNLNGGAGDDTYVYNLGDGNDYISDASGVDKILFGTGINQEDIRLVRDGNYLNIHIGADIIRLENQFNPSTTTVIETVEFADGSTLSLTDNFTWEGTDGVDTLNGFDADETFIGHGGADYLYGNGGNDVLNGGSGLDVLYGGSGADSFIFESASAFGERDNVEDFSLAQGDKLDLSDLLESFDPLNDLITDFVQIVDSGSNSIVSVDADGGADNFLQIAQISNVTGLTDEDALVTNGTLIV